jgi:hypothetical protein
LEKEAQSSSITRIHWASASKIRDIPVQRQFA